MNEDLSTMASDMADVLQQRLQPSDLEVLDESAAHAGHAGSNGTPYGTHFRVRITAPCFEGCSRVARHRLVYDALHDFIARGVHAIAIEAVAPPGPTA